MHKRRHEAEELREQGYSYKMIEQKLGISRATMSYWFKDRPFTPNLEVLARIKEGPTKVGKIRHENRLKEIREQRQRGIKEIGVLSKRELLILGIGIYIGEGSKSAELVRISNADPAVIKLGIRWLREACGLSDDNLSIRLHLYPDNNIEECTVYWQKQTKLPAKCFRQPTIDIRTNKQPLKSNKLPYGTAHVTVISNGDREKGRKLFRRLAGWMEGALNQV